MQLSSVSSVGSCARAAAGKTAAAKRESHTDFMRNPPEGGSGMGMLLLLVAKRLNRALERRLPGRVVPERNPHADRDDEGEGDCRERNDRPPLRIEGDDFRECVSDDDPREAAGD